MKKNNPLIEELEKKKQIFPINNLRQYYLHEAVNMFKQYIIVCAIEEHYSLSDLNDYELETSLYQNIITTKIEELCLLKKLEKKHFPQSLTLF